MKTHNFKKNTLQNHCNQNENAKITKSLDDISKEIPELAAAKEYGFDISMLVDNLSLTPKYSIRRHLIALNTIEKLRNARKL